MKRVDYVILEQSPLLPLHSEKKLAALDQGSAGKQRGRRVQAILLMTSVVSMGGGVQGVCEVKIDYVILGTSRHIPGGIKNWQQLALFVLERGR